MSPKAYIWAANGWNLNSGRTISLKPCRRVRNDFEAAGVSFIPASGLALETPTAGTSYRVPSCESFRHGQSIGHTWHCKHEQQQTSTATGPLALCSPNLDDYVTSLTFLRFLWLHWGFVRQGCYAENEQPQASGSREAPKSVLMT